MNLNQEEIRQQLILHKSKYGTSYAFVGRQIDLSRNSISMFANGNRALSETALKKIKNFLDNF
jgi:cyanate lyase